jgi:diphthamide synthase (EF-2-diphthine--ammonia ligase)
MLIRVFRNFLDLGFKTMLVCVDSSLLDQSFAGRIIDSDFLNDLPENVDPCGENGEFHTFVFDGPIFQSPIPVAKREVVYREYPAPQGGKPIGFYFQDIETVP